MTSLQPPSAPVLLARRVREQFVVHAEKVLHPLSDAIRNRLRELVGGGGGGTRGRQECRDAMVDFERMRGAWVAGTQRAWRGAVVPPSSARVPLDGGFELIANDVVERKILASRLALLILEKASWELSDLSYRMQHLEGGVEIADTDALRPETISQLLLEQWTSNGLTRETWLLVQDVVQQHMVGCLLDGYAQANAFLINQGVLPEIALSARVKRTAGTTSRRPPVSGAKRSADGVSTSLFGLGDSDMAGGGSGFAALGSANKLDGVATTGSGAGGVGDETRMMTAGSPLARMRLRANGVMGQLKRMLTERIAGFDPEHAIKVSPALAAAMSRQVAATALETQINTRLDNASSLDDATIYDDAAVEQVAVRLRQRTGELKKTAATSAEKATIEIVALMFQSILSEERIPPGVRVWFARLQMPVLRVAIAEPEFFGTLQHPARQLIDRMGSCVMGFDASTSGGNALETEIKRVVQVIEQYPETGRTVFQLVYDEFQKFLSRFLTEKGPTQRLATVAQQVEQKETMAIQYTIEMRNLLDDMPVCGEIQQFLFKVWAEVLAVAAVRHGPQHAETIVLKKSAADLVWAASAKPNRTDRTQVIQDLPRLLLRLRQGMTLIGVQGAAQEAHIKIIGDTLADAFLSKTEAIPVARIEELAKRLANLEDYVADDPATDLPLDADSIELMLGIDASMIEVVANGGSRPSDAMLAWAQELQLGNWFTLDHNNKTNHVQYAWCSERKQLHLFAAPDGRNFLVQVRRLAAYLQAGLLLPTEEEALTVRATREALAKLDANPERLLG